MCGIVGYVGAQPAHEVLMEGLSKLEYRGYDSAGLACIVKGTNALGVAKKSGKVVNLENACAGREFMDMKAAVGIAHTRWATHGPPTDNNAHPHLDNTGSIA